MKKLCIVLMGSVLQTAVFGQSLDGFESGDKSFWTESGSAWFIGPTNGYTGLNQYHTASGFDGSYWVDTWPDDGANHDNLTGTLVSSTFTLDGNLVTFRASGYGGNNRGGFDHNSCCTKLSDMNNTWALFLADTTTRVSVGTAPFREGEFNLYQIDVSEWEGQEAYFELTDAGTGGFGWFGFDDLRIGSRVATSVFTFEEGDDRSSWTLTGSFDFHAVLNNSLTNRQPREGGAFLRSEDSQIGSVTSPVFTVTRTHLEFDSAGFGALDTTGKGNRIKLDRETDGALLVEFGDDEVLGGDQWAAQSVDLSDFFGNAVYLVLEDVVDGGYGWVGIDDVRLTGDSLLRNGSIGSNSSQQLNKGFPVCIIWRPKGMN